MRGKFYDRILNALTTDDIGSISRSDITSILETAKTLFKLEGALVRIGEQSEDSFYVLGDIHGQYRDIGQILQSISKRNPEAGYLFLGDYVDRGRRSLHVMLTLLVMKCMHPNSIYLLRGNHECYPVNFKYGFLQELQIEFGYSDGMDVHEEFNEIFQYMPIAAILCDRFFCVHGGLSQKLESIKQIEDLKFPLDVVKSGTLQNELLWADPENDPNLAFGHKHNRGATFGKKAVEHFLEQNALDGIIRAHQCVEEGFETCFEDKVLTVFSAPNYGGRSNKAAVVEISNEEIRVLQFSKCCSDDTLTMDELCFEGVPEQPLHFLSEEV